MTAQQLRQKYIDFFLRHGHAQVPSAPVVPENDPTVLFTTAGMHPLVPYLLGQPHPLGKRLVDYQKCVRTDDIDEVGDTFHHTFFEMLGNWSLGDYFKKEAIHWSYEFLTKEINVDPQRIYITCFAGDADAPKDEESAAIWQSLGIPKERIFFLGKKDNWWGPAGQTGPCGPDTEMHYDITQKSCGPDCRPGCNCGRFCEIWNDVFMEFNKTADGKYEKLPKPNVDTGMGLERTVAVLNHLDDNYLTDLWQPAIKEIERLSNKSYKGNEKSFRIIADHLRASVFIICDGVQPTNKERGYILRRLIRRAVLQLHYLQIESSSSALSIAKVFIDLMKVWYTKLNYELVSQILKQEIERFLVTLNKGLNKFNKLANVDGKIAFDLFQTYGFPLEMTIELAKEKGWLVEKQEFIEEFHKHQNLSRTTSAGMFKGGLQDQSEITTKYHTATHLLHAALRKILGSDVHQAGSNITSERLRFDFTFPEKLTDAQIKQVEELVNTKIAENVVVEKQEMKKADALAAGALAFFPEKYPDVTSVYKIGDFSFELCGGPHVTSTGTLKSIKIIKQEAVSAGVRRIYATALSKQE